jgi:plasmid maintenance system killer protein
MRQFKDKRSREIYETRFASNVPEHVSIGAHKIMRIVVAAGSLQDIGLRFLIIRWRSTPDLFGIHVHGKWHVTFAWREDFGAGEICLERW